MSMKPNDEQIRAIARPLVRIVTEYYKDPKNEEKFQKWLLEKENQKSNAEEQ